MPSDHKETSPPEETEQVTAWAPSYPKVGDVGKRSMQGPEKIGNKMPVNYEYAGGVYSFGGKDTELHKKYPEGVRFDSAGFPDFSPYAKETVEIDMKGNYTTDFTDASKKAGLREIPDGFTWHHHQDCKTMQLVPDDLHGDVKHSGGCAVIKGRRKELENDG
jgi:filamentous hemagglutinin